MTVIINTTLETAIRERIFKIPVFNRLGVQIVRFGPGECEALVPRNPEMDGIFESYHGGMLMTAADTIACPAVMTLSGADSHMATTDMSIRFLAPCLSDVRVVARVIKPGKRLVPVHVDLYDMQDKLVAVAQVCYMLMDTAPQR